MMEAQLKGWNEKQRLIVELINYAWATGVLSDVPPELELLVALAAEQNMRPKDYARLIELVQEHVNLHVYTTVQAATWLGMSVRGLQDALYGNRISAYRPGHDLIFTHDELVRFNRSRLGVPEEAP